MSPSPQSSQFLLSILAAKAHWPSSAWASGSALGLWRSSQTSWALRISYFLFRRADMDLRLNMLGTGMPAATAAPPAIMRPAVSGVPSSPR